MAHKLLVLLNASAGSAGDLASIERAFADLGAQPIVRVFTKETCGGAMAEVARAAGDGSFAYDALVVGGGDGTIGAAAAAVAGTHVPLGILPMGTLNHFARDLGLPLRLPEAARVAAEGTERRVDVGLVNGRVFVNNSSIGIYPFLVAGRTREQRRRGLGKMAATAIAVARALRRSHWRRCTVTANGEKRSVRTACIFVGNNFYDLTRLGSRARLDEGALSIHIVKRQSWLGLIILPIIVGLGRARPERDIETIAAKDAVIASRKRHLRVAIDGEAVILSTPLRYESLPGRLIVRCPPQAGSSVPPQAESSVPTEAGSSVPKEAGSSVPTEPDGP
jgi:diacylglycerol kinase family enzyme